MTGAGVTLHFVDGATYTNASDADGRVVLSAPTGDEDPLRGLLIVYDRDNTNGLRATGNGVDQLTGAIYGQSATLDFQGSSCDDSITSLVVVGDIVDGSIASPPACWSQTYNEGLVVGSQIGEVALIAMPEEP